jgi:PAS domain S-box-containing protein
MDLESLSKFATAVVYECNNDADWSLCFINSYIEVLSGYPAEEFLNGTRSCSSIIHPEDRNLVEETSNIAIKANASYKVEYRIVRSDKTIRWVLETGGVNTETGKLSGFMIDITEQAELRATLAKSQAELDSFFSITLEKLCIADISGHFKKINKAWESLGYSADELLAISFFELIHPEDRLKTFNEIDKLSKGAPAINFENRYRCKDGSYKFLSWTTAPDPSTGLLYAAAHDVTKQKERESELKNVTDYLEEAQKIAKLGNWSFDLKTQKIEWSKQMYELFPESIESGPPTYERHRSTIHQDDLELWDSKVNACIKDGKHYSMRFRSVFPDKVLWIAAEGRGKLDNSGKLLAIYGTCQDITVKIENEEVLQSQRVMTLHAAKLASLGEMAASIAHEINNPLAILQGALSSLEGPNVTREVAEQRMQMMRRSTLRIEKIITGLRRFSRPPNAYRRISVPLKRIIEESMALLETKAKNKSVLLKFEVLDELIVNCEPLEIEQVIVNIVSNAIDAAIVTEDRWVKLLAYAVGKEATILVTDSGTNISQEIEKRLFQPFFTTKNVGEGTGLGLSISKNIVEAHNGTIGLKQTKPNTCFEITFPLQSN